MAEEEQKGFELRWEEIETNFKEYLTRINANIKQPERVDQVLSLSYNEMRALGYEECGENAYILTQQAYYLQQEFNYHKSKFDWCDSTLSYLLAKYSTDDKYVKRDDKAAKLAINNNAVQLLLKMLYTSKTYVTSLEFLSARMDKLAHSWEQLQYTKRKLT